MLDEFVVVQTDSAKPGHARTWSRVLRESATFLVTVGPSAGGMHIP